MGAPKFDQDMADRDAQADSANPNELSQRFANQSASGAQTMSVQVLPGLQGGMYMQVQTPNGLMQVQIPRGLQPGMAFHIQVPQPTAVELTGVSLTSRNEGDLERGGGAPAAEGSVVQPQGTPRARPQSASTSREGRNVAAARRRQEAARARANPVVPPPLPPGYPTELTKPVPIVMGEPMPPATPVGEEFGVDSGGFGDAGVVGPVAAVAVAATAEKGAVEVQARLQTDQLAERLVAASLDQPRPTTASPGASLSRQVASGTTSTPERVSTHVTQQLLLTVLSESVSSLPDKPMRSAACLPRCRALYLHDRAPSVPPCHHAHVHTVDVPTRLC